MTCRTSSSCCSNGSTSSTTWDTSPTMNERPRGTTVPTSSRALGHVFSVVARIGISLGSWPSWFPCRPWPRREGRRPSHPRNPSAGTSRAETDFFNGIGAHETRQSRASDVRNAPVSGTETRFPGYPKRTLLQGAVHLLCRGAPGDRSEGRSDWRVAAPVFPTRSGGAPNPPAACGPRGCSGCGISCRSERTLALP